eukprot:CAMPEP_0184485384 /NCGR_PEP_ID=MMETSP0113_2-20130426/6990_1 /TAXON_ID=91329 /ORGANISM="Norrisiella sphaerica, Strain BC52" /LENGTH=506 /DNA_ID=CAMNT_0026866803 /DNA_START=309 /DNA_END=1829 /DNA_ORIENTATION=-
MSSARSTPLESDPSRYPGPFSKTKIIATVGPSSESFEALEELWLAGADVFRVNMSHGTHEGHRRVINNIRELEKKYVMSFCSIGILLDLQGPKLRIGRFEDGPVMLEKGKNFRLDMKDKRGDVNRVKMPHPEIFEALQPGANLLLDDGKIRLKVTKCGTDFAETTVMVGGKLSERKGVNVPDVTLPISALTEKDKEDVAFGLEQKVDWMALSFVQQAGDIQELRNVIGDRSVKIMAKIEKPQAVADLKAVVNAADAVMVARGDLGVELSAHEVPVIQKRIVSHLRKVGKPVVVATQMLESMISTPVPTRAEASDVANAIYDGADAVMLSGESAAGKYPIEAVKTMEAIISEVEKSKEYANRMRVRDEGKPERKDAMIPAASALALSVNASVLICFTRRGYNGQRFSHERAAIPIIALSNRQSTARMLQLSWGIYPVYTACVRGVQDAEHGIDEGFENISIDEIVDLAKDVVTKKKLSNKGELLVMTGFHPTGAPGPGANLLKLLQL